MRFQFVRAQDSWTKTEKTKAGRRVGASESAGGRGREMVCFLTCQGHPELGCEWKSSVCLACLPHKIIQTGCSADNVTVLTTPPFSLCFKLSVKWQECGNVISTQTRTDRLRQGRTLTHSSHSSRCQTCDLNTHRRAH